jgi:hypothetical protein
MIRSRRLPVILTLLSCMFALAACGPADQSGGAGVDRYQLGENESYKDFGSYVIHVNAQTTDQLPAEVARNLSVVRSGQRALLNVVVMKKSEGLIGQAVEGDVQVSAANLTGQNKGITMRKVAEQDTVYYIGETSVNRREVLIFDIDVVPDGETDLYALRFKDEFYGE